MVREPYGKGGQAKPFPIRWLSFAPRKSTSCPPGRAGWPGPCRPATHPPARAPPPPPPTHSHQPCPGGLSSRGWSRHLRKVSARAHSSWLPAGRGPHERGTTALAAADGPILGSLGSQQRAPSEQHLQTGVPPSNRPAAGGAPRVAPSGFETVPGWVRQAPPAIQVVTLQELWGCILQAVHGLCLAGHWRRGSQGQPRSFQTRPSQARVGEKAECRPALRAQVPPYLPVKEGKRGRPGCPGCPPRLPASAIPGTNPVIVSPPQRPAALHAPTRPPKSGPQRTARS